MDNKLQMIYNKRENALQVMEPETYELYKNNPNYLVIDFKEGEIDKKISVEDFAKLVSKKLNKK